MYTSVCVRVHTCLCLMEGGLGCQRDFLPASARQCMTLYETNPEYTPLPDDCVEVGISLDPPGCFVPFSPELQAKSHLLRHGSGIECTSESSLPPVCLIDSGRDR